MTLTKIGVTKSVTKTHNTHVKCFKWQDKRKKMSGWMDVLNGRTTSRIKYRVAQ